MENRQLDIQPRPPYFDSPVRPNEPQPPNTRPKSVGPFGRHHWTKLTPHSIDVKEFRERPLRP